MIKSIADGLLIHLKIAPNASKNEIVIDGETIKIRVTAQPIENKANKALIELLSKKFKIPKSSVQIVKGDTSKEKTVFINIADEQKKELIISELTK